jgi:NTP pyrophosphatase (non-canonical NTP hydrolase)
MSKLHLKENPTLADIQQYVIDMEKERGFSNASVAEQSLLLVEEVGELCKVIRKHHTTMGVDVNKQYDFDAAGEIADVLIMLTAVANRLDIDIERAFRDKEEQNKQRTWK